MTVAGDEPSPAEAAPRPGLAGVVREWGRIGCIGFGGPPTHIALLRDLCVRRRRWLADDDFEEALAACNLLPGPASTQLSIYCAWRVRGSLGALVGGLAFIVPGLVAILALSALFLAEAPPDWVLGAGAGAGAAVAAVAVHAGWSLLTPSRAASPSDGPLARVPPGRRDRRRDGRPVARPAPAGLRTASSSGSSRAQRVAALLPLAATSSGGLLALSWVALKVGALSYGGGFVIVPLMQADAVDRYHWLTDAQFVNAVALGQITPGPVVHTVAAVGYGAHGLGGGLLAAAVAFAPSFAFVLAGGRRFETIRTDERARAFLDGAGPAAVGAILGSAIPLARALDETWQYAVLAGAAVLLLLLRRGPVLTLLLAGAVGVVVALLGGPLP